MNNNAGSANRWLVMLLAVIVGGLALTLAVSATSLSLLRTKLRQTETELAQFKQHPAADAGKVATLEKVIAEQAAAYEKLRAQLPATSAPAEVEPPRADAEAAASTNENRGAWMDRLREEDPERYKQLQEAREQRRKQTEEFFQKQFDRLDERLAGAKDQAEADLITNIADTLTHMEELRQQWQQVRDLPEEERREAMRRLGAESFENFQKLTDLRRQDRELQVQRLAGQIGYTSSGEINTFKAEVARIIDETEVNPMRLMGGGGRGGWRGDAPSAAAPAP